MNLRQHCLLATRLIALWVPSEVLPRVQQKDDSLAQGGDHVTVLYRKLASERETYGPTAVTVLVQHYASSATLRV